MATELVDKAWDTTNVQGIMHLSAQSNFLSEI